VKGKCSQRTVISLLANFSTRLIWMNAGLVSGTGTDTLLKTVFGGRGGTGLRRGLCQQTGFDSHTAATVGSRLALRSSKGLLRLNERFVQGATVKACFASIATLRHQPLVRLPGHADREGRSCHNDVGRVAHA